MMRYALTYGMLSGFVIVATALAAVMTMGQNHLLGSVWVGYLVMVLALTLIFVGVKRYRDVDHGGVIRFVPALKMGLAIALVAAAIYIIVWEIYLASTGYRFMDDYLAHIASQRQAAEGTPPAEIAREMAGMEWHARRLCQSADPGPDHLRRNLPGRAGRRPGLGGPAAQPEAAAGQTPPGVRLRS